jgi:hypothetical protein
MRITELMRVRRGRLSRYAHVLARSGKYESAEAIISEIRSHEGYDPATHEAGAFRAALGAICDIANRKRNGHWRKPPRLRRLQQQPARAA